MYNVTNLETEIDIEFVRCQWRVVISQS